MTKKLLSLFLALVMVLSIACLSAFASPQYACGHADIAEYTTDGGVEYLNARQHRYITLHSDECRECDAVYNYLTYRLENHTYTINFQTNEEMCITCKHIR